MYQTKILPRVIITYGACARGGGRRPGLEANILVQDVFFAQRARRLYSRACARGEPTEHAHVNGVVQCQPGQSPTIYHRNVRREKKERSVSVHTPVDCGDVW